MPSEDSKSVKKHDDDDAISTVKKVTNSNAKPHSKLSKPKKEPKEEPSPVPSSTPASRSKKSQIKKELKDYDSDEDDDDKPIARKISNTKVEHRDF